MSIIKCKMCGGDLNISEGSTIAVCEYCGSQQTVPTADNEKKMTLFARANRLRQANEFDKAAGVYESLVAEFPTEAEAYWGLVLCRYGIEYVDDPLTGKKIPTCHRSSYESVLDDTDYEQACENADAVARKVYREEAKTIEILRKGILEVSGKEDPCDIFICYKETDDNGQRTIDSVMAQDVYDALTAEGYRVFFSRISLEDKLGVEYEPYIFAALNSAKVMLVFGTDYEYFNAVWVKNEWSRFLSMMASGQKKTLIPCYKDIDPYDMPKEFSRLQAQDMGKIGALQDLLRGIGKILPRQAVTVVQTAAPATDAFLKRGYMALEDNEWEKANGFFEQALNIDPECAEAYVGLALAEGEAESKQAYLNIYTYHSEVPGGKHLARARQFADSELTTWIDSLIASREAYLEADREKQEKESKEREIQRLAAIAEKRACQEQKQTALIQCQKALRVRNLIGITQIGVFALQTDGKILFENEDRLDEKDYKKALSSWHQVIAIDAGGVRGIVGLTSSGQLGATEGLDYLDGKPYKQVRNRKNNEWTGIFAVSVGLDHILGLKSDGTVLAAGKEKFCPINDPNWKDIIAVSAGGEHSVGLKSDGTVVAAGKNKYGQCDVSGWKNIVAISAGMFHTVALKSDGTVVAAGDTRRGKCNVSSWRNIVAVSAGGWHTVGLKNDGSVVTVGLDKSQQCSGVENWKNILSISAGNFETVGLKQDGTVVFTGHKRVNKSTVEKWKLFNSLDDVIAFCKKRDTLLANL